MRKNEPGYSSVGSVIAVLLSTSHSLIRASLSSFMAVLQDFDENGLSQSFGVYVYAY